MKKIAVVIALAALAVVPSACGFNWDGFMEFNPPPLRIIFQIEPDDAHILLNGRFIGEAYEFSTKETALELLSKRNEIIVKRDGYVEEIVDLFDYPTTQITIRMSMKKALSGPAPAAAPQPASKPPATAAPAEAEKPEYVAKPVPPKDPAPDMDEAEELNQTLGNTVTVGMEILPSEAAIYLDGKFWGIAPEDGKISNLRLKPGTHTIVVTKPGYITEKKTIKVREKDQVQVIIKLKKTDEGMVL
jgi:hypothetical protein